MKHASTLTLALLATLALPVLAQTNTPNIDQRQQNQQQRIEQGVQSGALTPRETTHLEKGQAHVERMEDRAKADGTVTARERARLEHAENVQSRQIAHEKHDRQHDFNHDGVKDRPRHPDHPRHPRHPRH
ncbi:MAG: hypothetical protein CVU17_06875 [Betaproteobacteria bacterium HGW-Betaproteobacteria-11]|nr:MAG: hypothetical protein CVU17_06875 [Betaproteobacteria bacterium HGW-Betaproteobacteria-11]